MSKKPKPPKPVLKPIRILCRVSAPTGMKPWLAPHCACEFRGTAHPSEGRSVFNLDTKYGEHAIGATIVPDGAPSAEAEVRRLRRTLRWIRRILGPDVAGCCEGGKAEIGAALDEIDAALRRGSR